MQSSILLVIIAMIFFYLSLFYKMCFLYFKALWELIYLFIFKNHYHKKNKKPSSDIMDTSELLISASWFQSDCSILQRNLAGNDLQKNCSKISKILERPTCPVPRKSGNKWVKVYYLYFNIASCMM